MVKLLWFDTETTGTSPVVNDIIQISGIIVADGVTVEEFNLKCQPFSWDNISEEALLVNGITIEDMKGYPDPRDTYEQLIRIFDRQVDRFNKQDKFVPAGFNVRFDIDMLYNFFKKNKDDYCFSWLGSYPLDVFQLAVGLHYFGFVPRLENFRLETLAAHYGISLDAHDALSDVRATRDLARMLKQEVLRFGNRGGRDVN